MTTLSASERVLPTRGIRPPAVAEPCGLYTLSQRVESGGRLCRVPVAGNRRMRCGAMRYDAIEPAFFEPGISMFNMPWCGYGIPGTERCPAGCFVD